MANLHLECYPEDEEEPPVVDYDDDDSGDESDDSDGQDLDRHIVTHVQRPHQFEPLAHN